jgi:uncharacterized protein (TIGR00369 family)
VVIDRNAATSMDVVSEPVRGGTGHPSLAALTGVEAMRTWLDGRSPAPPLARLTGRRLVAMDVGTATFELPITPWVLGPKGWVHKGVLAFLAGAPLFGAVQSTLPEGTSCTTAEISMTFLGLPPGGGGNLTATGRLIATAGDTGLAAVDVTAPDGRLVAHGTARCLIFAPVDPATVPAPEAAAPEPSWPTPDPWRRELPGQAPRDADIDGMSGLEVLQATLRGDLPRPPIDRLTGIRLLEAGEGRVVFAMPASGWLAQEFGAIFGGAIALLGMSAASAAVQTTASGGTTFAALDVKVNLLRPVMPDGQDLVATGTVLHRGRRLAIGTSEVRHGGRLVAVVTGTTELSG